MNNTDSVISKSLLEAEQIFGLLLVIAGWFFIAWLNRKNEIAKKRIDFILPMYHKYIEIIVMLSNNVRDSTIFLNLVAEVR
jgi:hypothetical protein